MRTNGVHIGSAIFYGGPHGKVWHKCLNHAAGQKAKLAKAFPMGAGRFLIWALIPYADQWAPDMEMSFSMLTNGLLIKTAIPNAMPIAKGCHPHWKPMSFS